MLANLQEHPIVVKRFQKVAYLHLILVAEVSEVVNFGNLEEFGLQSASLLTGVHSVISRESLSGLTPKQQDGAIALFERYCSIFANEDFDLGCAKDILHKIETGDNTPIRLRPI